MLQRWNRFLVESLEALYLLSLLSSSKLNFDKTVTDKEKQFGN